MVRIKDLAEVFSGTIEDLAELKIEGGFEEKPIGLSFKNWSVLAGLSVTFVEQIQPQRCVWKSRDFANRSWNR